MKGNTIQKTFVTCFIVSFVFSFNGVSSASPYVSDLSITAHSGGIICSYTLNEDPVTGDQLIAATAWYKDSSPIMVLYLPFEGGEEISLVDYSGNSETVDIYGPWSDPEWIPDGGHDGSGAYEFDGNDAFDAGEIFPTRSSYTKTAWIYREVMGPEPWWNNIISGYTHVENNHSFRVDNEGYLGAGHNAGIMTVTDPEPIEFETWYFVAVTFDYDTGAMRLYKNGAMVDSDTVPKKYQRVTDTGVYIGRMEEDWMWQGKLDDIRIYDYVLSSDQILMMYESGTNTIVWAEVNDGEQWEAAVTPFNSTEAGDTVFSSIFTVGDDDSDGVPNELDNCPNTPAGVPVNANGCPLSETDSDGDGVTDDLDLCPDTPEGEEVDDNGCALSEIDTDGDGVTDDLDLCPNTPAGEQVDADGCPLSETDTDGDGVADDLDLCPNTPAGEQVDADGCALSDTDSDGDGVTDDLDLCPNTPEGEEVDVDGCAALQYDSDGDGIPDYMEQGPDPENPDPGFDGNEDGIADYLQNNVASCSSYDDKAYLTLVVTDPVGGTLSDVEALEPAAALPGETEFPYGNITFTINGVAVGGPATIKLYLPDGGDCDTYYKYGLTLDNQTDHWYEFLYDDTTDTGATIDGNVITLLFVDGERGDDDLTADGVIMDDGAPAHNIPVITPEAVDDDDDDDYCFISISTCTSQEAMHLVLVLLLVYVLAVVVRSELNRNIE